MKKITLFLITIIIVHIGFTQSPPQVPNNATEKQYSISVGWGNRNPVVRLDYRLSDWTYGNITPLAYIDMNFQLKKFDNENIVYRTNGYDATFDNNYHKYYTNQTGSYYNYTFPSKVYNAVGGIGVALDMQFNKFYLQPFIGAKYSFAEFLNQDFNGLIKEYHWYRSYNNVQVGPEIKTAYGDQWSYEIGTRVGYMITPVISLYGSISYSPIKYSTPNTLFGEYWGEAPIHNDYYIKISPLNFDVGVRYHF